MSKLTLVNAETGDQITCWVFCTTLADSAIPSDNLVRQKIYPETDVRPALANGDSFEAKCHDEAAQQLVSISL